MSWEYTIIPFMLCQPGFITGKRARVRAIQYLANLMHAASRSQKSANNHCNEAVSPDLAATAYTTSLRLVMPLFIGRIELNGIVSMQFEPNAATQPRSIIYAFSDNVGFLASMELQLQRLGISWPCRTRFKERFFIINLLQSERTVRCASDRKN